METGENPVRARRREALLLRHSYPFTASGEKPLGCSREGGVTCAESKYPVVRTLRSIASAEK